LSALSTSFASHQLCHSHNQLVHGYLIDPEFRNRSWGTKRS
jgi:enoyl-CoA hydratase